MKNFFTAEKHKKIDLPGFKNLAGMNYPLPVPLALKSGELQVVLRFRYIICHSRESGSRSALQNPVLIFVRFRINPPRRTE
jgi:hypothetical protein